MRNREEQGSMKRLCDAEESVGGKGTQTVIRQSEMGGQVGYGERGGERDAGRGCRLEATEKK